MAKSGTARPYYNVTIRISKEEHEFLEKLGVNKAQLFRDAIAKLREAEDWWEREGKHLQQKDAGIPYHG